MYLLTRIFLLLSLNFLAVSLLAQQQTDTVRHAQCGTMERQEYLFKANPAGKVNFEKQRVLFNELISEKRLRTLGEPAPIIYTIPIVFHIVLTSGQQVTDAQIMAQLDTLNKGIAGLNGDSVKIPAWFKSLYGKTGIQFCLAQRGPDGNGTTGIERTLTTQTGFSNTNDWVKHASTGGADIWDQRKYFNVWICELNNSILGYSTFPTEDVPDVQGVVVEYRSLPGGSYNNYNSGKTLVHETGHYFNLFHIWGNTDNSCADSDFVEDTPNQYTSTSGCYSGIRTDNCTPSGNGIMYQNFMDYSYDPCLVMFTAQQAQRMESALTFYRSSLLSSDGCEPPKSYDARILSIDNPLQRMCESTFTPVITLKNEGSQTLTSLAINVRIDNEPVAVYNWTGSLVRLATVSIPLDKLTTATGNHTLTVYGTNPNNTADENTFNDTLFLTYQYYLPVSELSEGFEGTVFPPQGWDIVNNDKGITWQRFTGAAKSGAASAYINNSGYTLTGQKDDLRAPDLILQNLDSAFLSFQVAAAGTAFVQPGNIDTLEVLVSSDCGHSFTRIYRKAGSDLNTRATTSSASFIPSGTEWRKDSVDLSAYINKGTITVAFRSTNENQNNIFLDDINLRKVIVDPALKIKGILITPNPVRDEVTVRFYPQPVKLKSVQIYNILGQKMAEALTVSGTNNNYIFNMSSYAAGTYIVRVVFSDEVVTKKIIKL